jgi:Protein of unknown function (DUF2948)
MTDLKLLALDGEDLEVISAHVQDAVIRVGDMGYVARDRKFALLMNRYAWEADSGKGRGQRRRAALHFDRVLSAKISGIDQTAHDGVLELLSIGFEEADPPGGVITLNFAGGGTVRLEVECIEARLVDGGAAWAAKARPAHQD